MTPDDGVASRLAEIRRGSRSTDLIEGQGQHVLILIFLLAGAAWFLEEMPATGTFLWLDGHDWAWIAIATAVLHQIVVALVFRLQLHRGAMTALFGESDLRAWCALFFPLLAARPLLLLIVAILDAGSLGLWRPAELALGVIFLALAGYTMRSVRKYFGFLRAAGGDHFREEYRARPLVREGVFRWSQNAMYTFGFLGLWAIALLFGSTLALVVAAFQHAYIWVHMYTVEGPDMRRLYGTPGG